MGAFLHLSTLSEKEANAFDLPPEQVVQACAGEALVFSSGDKEWHALHYLLTGSADRADNALSILVDSGEIIEGEWDGTLFLSASQMRAFNHALSAMTDDELRERYTPAAMAEANVYIADVLLGEMSHEGGWQYVTQKLPELRHFAKACADRGCAATVWIG